MTYISDNPKLLKELIKNFRELSNGEPHNREEVTINCAEVFAIVFADLCERYQVKLDDVEVVTEVVAYLCAYSHAEYQRLGI